MTKIKDTSLAAVGIYYGTNKNTSETQIENITSDSLKRLSNIYQSVPLTINHESKNIIGYVDELKVIQDMLIGNLNIYDDVNIQETALSKYISPEFVIKDSDNTPVSIIYFSIVDTPAISENLPILTDNDIVENARTKKPYRFNKNRVVEITDSTACKQCKQISNKTKGKPITWEKANEIVPVHPNCRCKIKKL